VEALHEENIHTAVETNAGTQGFRSLIGQVDLLVCDIKSLFTETNDKYTGANVRLVKENLQLAVLRQPTLLLRVTLVNGVNNTPKEKMALLEQLQQWRIEREELQVEILRQHHMGEPKYLALGMDYPMRGVAEVGREAAEEWASVLRDSDIAARVVS
jgi:pyruvate formate lyase activating enzyme